MNRTRALFFILSFFFVSFANAQRAELPRQPWVYVVQHWDHQTMFYERWALTPSNSASGFNRSGHWEFSLNVTNGALSKANIRVQVFNHLGQQLYSAKSQVLSGTGAEPFHWATNDSTMLKDFTARTFVLTSDIPLHVDALASYQYEVSNYSLGMLSDSYSKRNVPVKEIECAKQSSHFGWFCLVHTKP